MSFINYKPEILIAGEWLGNTQVFATKKEAEQVAFQMLSNWSEAEDYRAAATIELVNSHVSMSDQEDPPSSTTE